jgi:hypothetical protein
MYREKMRGDQRGGIEGEKGDEKDGESKGSSFHLVKYTFKCSC